MKILVTGANGFIGRNIKSILPQEAEVIGIGFHGKAVYTDGTGFRNGC